MSTITFQTRPSGTPVCTVCSDPRIEHISAELTDGAPVSKLVEKYDPLSRDALYRHAKRHHALRLVTVAAVNADEEVAVLSLVDRLDRIAHAAQRAADAAYGAGDLALGAKLNDSAVRALGLLSDRLGVEHDTAVTYYRRAMQRVRHADGLSQTMFAAATEHPEIASVLASHADRLGMADVAARLRDLAAKDSDPLEISA
jgi:hypothetical protein